MGIVIAKDLAKEGCSLVVHCSASEAAANSPVDGDYYSEWYSDRRESKCGISR